MIARIWKGWTTIDNAREYERVFRDVVLPEVTRGVPGYKGANLLKHPAGDEVEFTTIFWFERLEDVKTFAGDHFERAVVPAPARAVLLRYQDSVQHHQVVV